MNGAWFWYQLSKFLPQSVMGWILLVAGVMGLLYFVGEFMRERKVSSLGYTLLSVLLLVIGFPMACDRRPSNSSTASTSQPAQRAQAQPTSYEQYAAKIRPLADELLRMHVLLDPNKLGQEPLAGSATFQKQMKEVEFQFLKMEPSLTVEDRNRKSMQEIIDAMKNLRKLDRCYTQVVRIDRETNEARSPSQLMKLQDETYQLYGVSSRTGILPNTMVESIFALVAVETELANKQ